MVEAETKSCQSCKADFTIASEDFVFYAKIDVPPPTWCPDCRVQRRYAWRNEWRMFRKASAKDGSLLFSNFSPQSIVKVYSVEDWYGDSWDPMDYGRDYDFTTPFFTQIAALLRDVPIPARSVDRIENSDFSMNAKSIKNCYMVRAAEETEDSAYMVWDHQSRSCFDCHVTNRCELCYGSLNLDNCYQTHFSVNCEGCRDVILSRDCVGSSNLIGCTNLRGKQYYIFNTLYSKDEYFEKLASFKLDSYEGLQALTKQAHELWRTQPHKFMQGSSNESVTGDYLYECTDAYHCYRARGVEHSKYCQSILSGPVRDCYDYSNMGIGGNELMYDCLMCGIASSNIKFSWLVRSQVRDIQYSMYCEQSSDLFGCIGLRKKQYCIFNKQYTQEQYEVLVPKIIEHMNAMPYTDKLGRIYRYGEFFPLELSPIEYNVSIAQEYFPLTQEQASSNGYSWVVAEPAGSASTALATADLPDSIAQVDERIVGQAITCADTGECEHQCSTRFTVMAQELAFLLEQGLPLPRLCPNCRHYSRINQRQPLTLHERTCDCAGAHSRDSIYTNIAQHSLHTSDQPCPTQFTTTFAPDRPEVVYCEDCYQAEIV